MSETTTAPRQPVLRSKSEPIDIHRGEPGTPTVPVGPEVKKRDPLAELIDKFEKVASALGVKEPGIVAGLNRLVEQAAEPGRTEQPLFRTQVAYMLQDVEKLVGVKIPSVPGELRTELTRLAGSSPGLENRQMEALLRGTPGVADRGLIRDIRRSAATIAGLGDQQNTPQVQDMVEVLENRLRLATRYLGVSTVAANPDVTPAAAQPTKPTIGPKPDPVRAARSPGDDAKARVVTEPIQPALNAERVAKSPELTQVVGKPKNLMSSIMDGFRAPNGPTPPWEPPPAAMKERVSTLEERLADGRTDQHLRAAEKSGQVLMQSMETFMNGPGAGVLGKIEVAASTEPGGMRAVMSEMQPGGRYASLRSEFDNALQQDRAFAASFKAVEKAAVQYGHDRLTLGTDFQDRKMDASQLEARFDRADAAIAGAAEKIPGRSPGQSIMAEMAEKVGDLLSKAADRVRQIFAREREAGPRQGPSPGMTT